MKQITLFFLIFLSTFTLYAEQPSNTFLVGYVDQELVISELPETTILEQKWDSQKVIYEAEYAIMQKEYNQRVKQYIELNKQMSEPIKMARQAEITEYERRLVLYKQRYQDHLNQIRLEGEAKINNRISEASVKEYK